MTLKEKMEKEKQYITTTEFEKLTSDLTKGLETVKSYINVHMDREQTKTSTYEQELGNIEKTSKTIINEQKNAWSESKKSQDDFIKTTVKLIIEIEEHFKKVNNVTIERMTEIEGTLSSNQKSIETLIDKHLKDNKDELSKINKAILSKTVLLEWLLTLKNGFITALFGVLIYKIFIIFGWL